jgi:hypothetical protein
LDFLGFSRPNRDFSMSYAAFSAKIFSGALLRGVRPAGTGACDVGPCGSAGLFMGQA